MTVYRYQLDWSTIESRESPLYFMRLARDLLGEERRYCKFDAKICIGRDRV